MTLEEKITHLKTTSMEQARAEGNAIIDSHREALDKVFFMLYICRCEYQWIKGLIKKNEKETSTI